MTVALGRLRPVAADDDQWCGGHTGPGGIGNLAIDGDVAAGAVAKVNLAAADRRYAAAHGAAQCSNIELLRSAEAERLTRRILQGAVDECYVARAERGGEDDEAFLAGHPIRATYTPSLSIPTAAAIWRPLSTPRR